MIELTREQRAAIDTEQQPATALNPRTGQKYRLIREEIYEKLQGLLRPFGRNWDNPEDDDLIRKDL
jgi:hypothetical protein